MPHRVTRAGFPEYRIVLLFYVQRSEYLLSGISGNVLFSPFFLHDTGFLAFFKTFDLGLFSGLFCKAGCWEGGEKLQVQYFEPDEDK